MIKATELRIGNKIKIGNIISTVTGGHLDYCGDKTEVKEFYPIPLTPEILEKAGFEKHLDEYHFPGDADLTFTLNDGVLTPNPYYTSQPFTKKGYPRYLHQLQNLIFALTGEELVIKELTPA